MSIMYPPYIEGVIPAFGPTLKVPFEWNPGVAPSSVKNMVVKILDLNNQFITYLFSTKFDNNIAVFNNIMLNNIDYYKIQLAYTDSVLDFEEWKDIEELCSSLYYSSIGIGKYFGNSNPEVLIEFDTKLQSWVVKYNNNNTSELPYSCDIWVTYNETLEYKRETKYFTFNQQVANPILFSILHNAPDETSINAQITTSNGFVTQINTQVISPEGLKESEEKIVNYVNDNIGIQIIVPESNDLATKKWYKSKDLIFWTPYNINNIDYYVEPGQDYYYGVLQNDDTILYTHANTHDENTSLIDANHVLPISFNSKISSFKAVTQEQKLETIGGQFPIFQRNGNLNYKEFSINGLISYHMDQFGSFIGNKNDLGLSNNKEDNNLFPQNLQTANLVDYNIRAEKIFRIEVLKWLNNGQPKIFKSPTEGMYLVRLMNVSLTPEEKLGRMIYSFSANAYEIDKIGYDTLIKYKLLEPIGDYDYVVE